MKPCSGGANFTPIMTYFNAQGPVYAFYDMLAAWFDLKRVPVTPVYAAFRERALAGSLPETVALPPRYVIVAPGCSDFGKGAAIATSGMAGPAGAILSARRSRPSCSGPPRISP